jgi:hypothetical protein
MLDVESASSSGNQVLGLFFQANQPTGSYNYLKLGMGASTKNEADLLFHYAGNGSNSNYFGIGFYGISPILFVFAGGQVAVGTSSPTYTTPNLFVNGSIDATGDSNNVELYLNPGYAFSDSSSLGSGAASGDILYLDMPQVIFRDPSNSYSTQMTIKSNTVKIGSLPASGGSIVYESSGVLGLNTSDRRLKKNIRPITNALDRINHLNGITFEYRSNKIGSGRRMGVIAQEVRKVAPELIYPVEHNGKEYLGVRHENLTALLIEGMKEQQKQIRKLQRQVAELKRHG